MKTTTLQTTLFKAFALIVLCVALLMNLTYLVKDAPAIQAQTFQTIDDNLEDIQFSIDESFHDMKMTAIDITYSNIFRTTASQLDFSDYLNNAKITDVLLSLLGSSTNIDQIYLYNPSGALQYGLLEGYSTVGQSFPFWVKKINAEDSVSFVYNSGQDKAVSNLITSEYNKNFISYILKYYDAYNKESGFIELKQSMGHALLDATLYDNVYGEELFVFDYDGSVLYHSSGSETENLYELAKENNFPDMMTPIIYNGHNQYIVCEKSTQSDIVSVMLISQSKMMSPIWAYCLNNFLIALFGISIALPIAFHSARKVTVPINQVREMAKWDSLENPLGNIELETDIVELLEMAGSINQMKSELHESMEKQIMLQTQRMQSHMLALQSQMNPHFLYNSLSTIQAMADEGLTEEIVHMCQSMSNILRYIASNRSETVPIHEELKYTKDYLECMKIRYQGDLFYNIEMDNECVNIRIPKLAIQQMVENAVKYTSTGMAPYVITIHAFVDKENGVYRIEIKDNGPGFDSEVLSTLEANMKNIRETNMLPSLEINGMGILNVFMRLHLFHKDGAVLDIKNNNKAGSCVTIGGPYNEK